MVARLVNALFKRVLARLMDYVITILKTLTVPLPLLFYKPSEYKSKFTLQSVSSHQSFYLCRTIRMDHMNCVQMNYI